MASRNRSRSCSDEKKYLGQLYFKATKYIENCYSWLSDIGSEDLGYYQVKLFYRCKPREYFKHVEKYDENVLKPVMKDNTGDPRSPINGKIAGVFLGVNLFRGGLPNASPFGNTRVSFPIEAIFTGETNLYFTDFYCMSSKEERYHYVTLVLTKAGSADDKFCDSNLLKLNPSKNPILWTCENGFRVVKVEKLIVEIFYTEKIYLNNLKKEFGHMVSFNTVGIIGQGSSTPGGLPKYSSCSTCNPNRNSPVDFPP